MMLNVNGRPRFYAFLNDLVDEGHGRYTVRRVGHPVPYRIEGGKKAGGTSRDWFVDHPSFQCGSIRASGLVDALALLEGM